MKEKKKKKRFHVIRNTKVKDFHTTGYKIFRLKQMDWKENMTEIPLKKNIYIIFPVHPPLSVVQLDDRKEEQKEKLNKRNNTGKSHPSIPCHPFWAWTQREK